MTLSDGDLRDALLTYARSRRNGALEGEYTHQGTLANASCGDRVELRVTISDGRIATTSFAAAGCALSTASTAILDEIIPGYTAASASEIATRFVDAMTDPDGTLPLPEELAIFEAVRSNPARRECVLLPWRVLLSAVR